MSELTLPVLSRNLETVIWNPGNVSLTPAPKDKSNIVSVPTCRYKGPNNMVGNNSSLGFYTNVDKKIIKEINNRKNTNTLLTKSYIPYFRMMSFVVRYGKIQPSTDIDTLEIIPDNNILGTNFGNVQDIINNEELLNDSIHVLEPMENTFSQKENQLYSVNSGFRPNPGITSINLKTLTASTGLREITVNISAFTLKQLEDIMIYFCRPGSHILIEWCHSSYSWVLSTPNEILNEFKNTSGGDYVQLFKSLYKKIDLSSGNYDCMLCNVKNFNWKYDPSSREYNITVTLISPGQLATWMRLTTQYFINKTKNTTDGNDIIKRISKKTSEYKPKSDNKKSKDTIEEPNSNPFIVLPIKKSNSKNNADDDISIEAFAEKFIKLEYVKRLFNDDTTTPKTLQISDIIKEYTITNNRKQSIKYYIPYSFVEYLINTILISSTGVPVSVFSSDQIINLPNISVVTKTEDSKEIIDKYKVSETENLGKLGLLYINYDFFKLCFSNNKLHEAINQLISGISIASGNVFKLSLIERPYNKFMNDIVSMFSKTSDTSINSIYDEASKLSAIRNDIRTILTVVDENAYPNMQNISKYSDEDSTLQLSVHQNSSIINVDYDCSMSNQYAMRIYYQNATKEIAQNSKDVAERQKAALRMISDDPINNGIAVRDLICAIQYEGSNTIFGDEDLTSEETKDTKVDEKKQILERDKLIQSEIGNLPAELLNYYIYKTDTTKKVFTVTNRNEVEIFDTILNGGSNSLTVPHTQLKIDMLGIAGFITGNLLMIDILPRFITDICSLFIVSVEHNISNDGWTTGINCMMALTNYKNQKVK